MRYRALGQSGIEASIVGLGTWAIGGLGWGGTDEGESIRAIHAALDAGINLIDTAPVYGLGLSEEIVGKAVAHRRDRAVLATKCGHVWHIKKGRHAFDWGDRSVYIYLGPESVRYEIEQSLRRLRTDYVDLYQTHWPDPATPIEDTMAVLLRLKDQGKIRAIGVSNVTTDILESYQKCGQVDSDQERYSMLDRQIESGRLRKCRKSGIAMLAYSPLAQGLLTGKVGPYREFPEGDQRREYSHFSRDSRKKVIAFLDAIKPVADAHGLTVAQLVLAWTAYQPGITHVLAGARSPEQASENARAGEVELSEKELNCITETLNAQDFGFTASEMA